MFVVGVDWCRGVCVVDYCCCCGAAVLFLCGVRLLRWLFVVVVVLLKFMISVVRCWCRVLLLLLL